MANSIDRLQGHEYAPGADPAAYGSDFLTRFDGSFFLFCTLGLMFVILSQYARHRRRRKNLDKMRAYWEEQRRQGQPDHCADPRLRFDAGFWGSGD